LTGKCDVAHRIHSLAGSGGNQPSVGEAAERLGKCLENFEARSYFRISKVYEDLREWKPWVPLLTDDIEEQD